MTKFLVLMTSLCSLFSIFYNNDDISTSPTTKEFKLAAFEGISLKSSFNVVLKYGSTQRVLVTGSEALISKIKLDVKNKVLSLDMQKGRYKNIDLVVEITLPYFNLAHIAGSGDINIAPFSNLSDVELSISGSGNIRSKTLEIQNTLQAQISGSGNIKASGRASKTFIKIAGSGDCHMASLVSTNSNSSITGSGNIEVHVVEQLEAAIIGSGNIYYKGNPSIKKQTIGSGQIQPI